MAQKKLFPDGELHQVNNQDDYQGNNNKRQIPCSSSLYVVQFSPHSRYFFEDSSIFFNSLFIAPIIHPFGFGFCAATLRF